MTWFRLDDGWLRHPKHRAAGLKGRALWIAAGTWSSEQLTDGRIPKEMLPVLAIDAEIGTGRTEARRLVEIGLWDDHGDAWQFHDWHDFQPSRADVLAIRAKREQAGALANHTRWHVKKGRIDPSCPHCVPSDPKSDPTTDSDRISESDPMLGIPPARPDPTHLLVTSEQQHSYLTRGEPEPAAAAAGPPATSKDRRSAVLEAAIAEVATRRGRYDTAQAKDDPSSWLASALAGIRSELLEHRAHERIHAGATATDLADLIAPTDRPLAPVTPIRPGPAPVVDKDRSCTCGGTGWIDLITDDDAPVEVERCPTCNPDPLDAPTPA